MFSLIQQANSHGGSGLVSVTARYNGSSMSGHEWKMVAKVNGKKIYSNDQYKTGFIDAGEAAQRFADFVYEKVYVEHRENLEPTDRELEADLAAAEELLEDYEFAA